MRWWSVLLAKVLGTWEGRLLETNPKQKTPHNHGLDRPPAMRVSRTARTAVYYAHTYATSMARSVHLYRRRHFFPPPQARFGQCRTCLTTTAGPDEYETRPMRRSCERYRGDHGQEKMMGSGKFDRGGFTIRRGVQYTLTVEAQKWDGMS